MKIISNKTYFRFLKDEETIAYLARENRDLKTQQEVPNKKHTFVVLHAGGGDLSIEAEQYEIAGCNANFFNVIKFGQYEQVAFVSNIISITKEELIEEAI